MQSKTLEIRQKNGVTYITFPLFSRCGKVRHLFSTRLGGVSTGDCAAMNLSFSKDSSKENVMENFRRLCIAARIDPAHLVLSAQTHTDHIRTVTEQDRGTGISKPSFSDVDGLITNRPGVALVTQYADCVPLLFCDPVQNVIATSHAGWRGTVQEIGKKTVERMQEEFGCEPKSILAAIGPCVGSCCYEVDQPLFDAFSAIPYLPMSDLFTKKENGKYMLDLKAANRFILLHAGILPEHIDVADLCTCCEHTWLHSHRATNGKRGTLAAIIELI